MKRRKVQILSTLACLALLGFLAGCGGSKKTKPTPKVSIAATSGSPQSTQVGTAFAAPLVATVTKGGSPSSGVSVTFTAPGSGASGTFAGGSATETDTTNSSGVATSSAFTANTHAGAYSVTASTSGASTPASFNLSNTAGAAASVSATAGTPQSTSIGTAFATHLAATVTDSDANPVSGVVVTFTAPDSDASGTFTDSATNTTTATTNASGVATAAAFTANSTTGSYTVTATVAGIEAPANFSLTNNPAAAGSQHFSFYLSGEESSNDGPNYYALAGAVQINAAGTVLGGEQDYNDAFGFTSPEPAGDTITGGTLTVNASTGQGTLTLITNNSDLGVGGTETFGVQFVNSSHALIMQFDGSATSSGSMDAQTLPSTPAGGFAFTLSGVDSDYDPVALGGVFTISGTSLANGSGDINDDGEVVTAVPFSGTLSGADTFGRGTITGIEFGGVGVAINYYVVGPEAIRIIDVDDDHASIGSAFGQGTNATSANNASLGSSVLALAGNPFQGEYGALAQFSTSNTSSNPAHFAGVGDDNELDNGTGVIASAVSGTYTIASNGYGSWTVTNEGLESVVSLGIYLTDPNLNLEDPNNPSGGGGALVLDMNSSLAGGTGVMVPQTSTAGASFAGNYAVGWQDFNYFSPEACADCEFDMLAQGTMASGGALSLTGLVSDPFFTLGTPHPTSSGDTFTGTPNPDASNHGRYSMIPPNSLAAAIDGANGGFDLSIYQASGTQLFWLCLDDNTVFVGPLEQQGSLTGLPAVSRPLAKPEVKPKH